MFLKRLSFLIVFCCAVAFSAQTAVAQTAADSLAPFVGKWSGSFDGATSGNCEMTLSANNDGRLAGQLVVIMADGNRYTVPFKSVEVKGAQFVAVYDSPGDGGEIRMNATRTDQNLKGSWKAGEEASGSWQMARAKQ